MEKGDNSWCGSEEMSFWMKLKGVKLKLESFKGESGQRQHNATKMAKKRGSQSAILTFTKDQESELGFKLHFNKTLGKDGKPPDDSGLWRVHDMKPFIDEWMLNIMKRVGG